MREILFRGKKISDGEWIEGDLLRTTIDCVTYSFIFKDNYTYNKETGDVTANNRSLVEPATVGQYTGLTDKNGKRIFEGDMIKPFDDEIDKMVVEFHYGCFVLCLYGERGYMGESGWCEEGNYGVIECEPLSSYGEDIEIIGNVHDNPELIGGGEDG